MQKAPYRMIASGIGDLYSKPVSNADWRLGAELTGSFYSPIVMEIVDAGNSLLQGIPERLPQRDADAVGRLTGAVMLSGIGMQAAGSSGPASGGEHLVSHYLDMTAEAAGEAHDFHGCQVAVGTMVTASLYERLLALDPRSIDVEAAVSRLPSWEDYQAIVQTRFGSLVPAVLPHARESHPRPDQLRARLTHLVERWDDISVKVGTTLRPADEMAAELTRAACPVHFDAIGVGPEKARMAVVHARDIRGRYTILHLLWDLGLLERWGAEAAARWARAGG
jgi:glycerol-1-phosphate dehydrogenase [NAD(P)+]